MKSQCKDFFFYVFKISVVFALMHCFILKVLPKFDPAKIREKKNPGSQRRWSPGVLGTGEEEVGPRVVWKVREEVNGWASEQPA